MGSGHTIIPVTSEGRTAGGRKGRRVVQGVNMEVFTSENST